MASRLLCGRLRVGICLLLCRGLLLRGLFALLLLAHMVTDRATGGRTGQAVVAGYVSCDTADQTRPLASVHGMRMPIQKLRRALPITSPRSPTKLASPPDGVRFPDTPY